MKVNCFYALFDVRFSPFGAVVTTCKNLETKTKKRVTKSPARSPPPSGIKKLIQDTITNMPDGMIICNMWLTILRSSLTQKPVTE